MFLKIIACSHEFYGWDLKPRDDEGKVSWACCKCGKVFKAYCGLDILREGICRGGWSAYTDEEKGAFKLEHGFKE